MKGKRAQAYLDGDGFRTVKSVLELDVPTIEEVLEALDQEREDPLLNPWRRGYDPVIRAVLGH